MDENSLVSIEIGHISNLNPLDLGGSMMSLVAGGPNGEVWVIPVEISGQIRSTAERSNDLESKLSEYDGARLLSAAHASVIVRLRFSMLALLTAL